MRTVSDKTWNAEVVDADVPVLVMFSATWCRPCAAAGPVLERFEEATGGKVRVLKADIEQAGAAAVAARVQSVPTFVLYSRGGVVATHTGYDARLVDTLRGMVETGAVA